MEERKISRQRRWQIRMFRNGRCTICGKPVSERSKRFCEDHRISVNVRKAIWLRGKTKEMAL